MERNFYNDDDFEWLIRQKADQYKMYPSDQVWKGIHQSLHGRRRWRWAGLAILLLGIATYTGDWYMTGKPAGRLANNMQPSLSAANQTPGQNGQAINQPSAGDNAASPSPASLTTAQPIFPARTGNSNIIPGAANADRSNNVTTGNQRMAGNPIINPLNGRTTGNEVVHNTAANITTVANSQTNETARLIINDPVSVKETGNETSAAKSELPLKPTVEKPADNATTASTLADAASESVLDNTKRQNWLEEQALFQLAAHKPKRFALQMYFSPTVNYRQLTGSASYPSSVLKNIPLQADIQGDVDQYVKHKPALGFELGTNVSYRASRRISVRAGVQFNYSRYNIEAFATQPEVATIALSTSQAFLADTISSVSSIRNLSGYAQESLSNQYFQLSMPIGVDVRVIGTDRLQLNVAGTIQPTYLLNRNSYLITTDYKNYMREPSLVRRWNVNGGVEAYVSYHTGTVRWQMGPQFRYQLLSSYSRKYPIKEQLMEYGIKIGVSKTLR